MKIIEHTERAVLEKLSALVDAAEGYPKLGRNALTGEVVQPPPGRPLDEAVGATVRHAQIVDHPSGGRFGYPLDGKARARIAQIKADVASKIARGVATPDEVKIHALGGERDDDATWERARPPGT